MSTGDLFGGAIALSIPQEYIDVSNLRQVPDNQEVFVNRNSDSSIIVEILELAIETTANGAARFHFDQLAKDNSASQAEIDHDAYTDITNNQGFPEGSSLSIVSGMQTIAKFGQSHQGLDQVQIFLAVFRLPAIDADIMISWNIPLSITRDGDSSVRTADAEQRITLRDFMSLINTFAIKDYSLFQS